ncbi:uncharacterized protein [Amphiura filiformis]|uniref:uncharacterized protein n=1 Tax=Amphiura filiformis TaxID=82378 RepID=UPI003B225769
MAFALEGASLNAGARPKTGRLSQATSLPNSQRLCCICNIAVQRTHYKVIAPSRNIHQSNQSLEKYAALQNTLNKALDVDNILAATTSRDICDKCQRRADKIFKSSSDKEDFVKTFHATQRTRNAKLQTPTKPPEFAGRRAKRLSKGTPSPSSRPTKRTSLSFSPLNQARTPTASTGASRPSTREDVGDQDEPVAVPLTDITNQSTSSASSTTREPYVQAKIKLKYGQSNYQEFPVDDDWVNVLERLCFGGKESATKYMLSLPGVHSQAVAMVASDIKRECASICSGPSLFRDATGEKLTSWSTAAQADELNKRTPTFLTCLEAAGTPAHLPKNKVKDADKIQNGLMTAAGVILKTRNNFMNSHQTMISLALRQGGAGEKTFRRLQSIGVCNSYRSTDNKLDELCIDYDLPVRNWQSEMVQDLKKERQIMSQIKNVEAEMVEGEVEDLLLLEHILDGLKKDLENHNKSRHPGYQLVGDNVDMKIHVRQMTVSHQNTDLHHFNHLAVKNRVNAFHLPDDKPICPPDEFQPNLVLPNVLTNAALRSSWIVLIGRIISEHITSFAWFKDHLPDLIPHEHMAEAGKKSETVGLGVLPYNENTKEGMKEIMKNKHTRVPGHGTPDRCKIIDAGDLLTAMRGSAAQENVRDANKPGDALDDLIPVIADFHLQANSYDGIWKQGFDKRSVGEPGTLTHAKTLLMAKNVKDNPIADVNAAEEFLKKYTHALIIAAALEFFGLEDVSGVPTKNAYDGQEPKQFIEDKLGALLDQFAIPDNTASDVSLLCPKCSKKYATMPGLRKHMEEFHGPGAPEGDENPSKEDGIYNYSCYMLCLCLLSLNFTDARQMGDGERLMIISRYLMIFFKLSGKHNYSYHTLRMLSQVNALLSPRQAYNLKWNRFVNTHNKTGTNIEPDRFNEHYNREYKDNFRGLHGKVTTAATDRISQSSRKVTDALHAFDKANKVKPRSRGHTSADFKDDVQLLSKRMHEEHIFEQQGNRFHKSFPGMKNNFMAAIDHAALNKWIRQSFKYEARKGIWSSA